MGLLRRTLSIVAVLFLAAQFIRPGKTNPAADPARSLAAHTQMPLDVQRLLARSCNDCHSYQTRWPWYSNVAPAMWLVRNDVNTGRRFINFDDWTRYGPGDQGKLLEFMCDWTRKGRMPLWFYLPMHRDARVSTGDVQTLCTWTDQQRQRLATTNAAR